MVLCIGIFALPTHAATYYVDSVGGSDSNNGTSSSTPWQTIAKVNSSTFSPGDNVLFKTGDTWREELIPPSSGTTSTLITFGAYGSGEVPVISGSNLVATSSWSAVGGNVYSAPFPAPTGSQLVQNGTFTTGITNWDQLFNAVAPSWQSSPIGGRSDVLKIAINSTYNFTGQENVFTGNGSTSYTLTYSYYIPSSNSVYTDVQAAYNSCFTTTCQIGNLNTATNTWTQVTVSNFVPASGTDAIYFNGTDSGGGEWQTPGASDAFYISDVSIEQNEPFTQVFQNGSRLTQENSTSTMVAGSFFYSAPSSTLYAEMSDNSNPSSKTVKVSERNYAVSVANDDVNNVSLVGLDTTEAANYDIWITGTAGDTVSGMSATYAYNDGIRLDGAQNITVTSSTGAWNGDDGIAADDAPNLIINGFTAYDNAVFDNDNYSAGIKLNPDFGGAPSSTDVTIENSESYSNGLDQPAANGWLGAGIWTDTIEQGLLIEHNLVYDNNLMGIYLDAGNNQTVAYNVSYDNGQPGAMDAGGISIYGDSRTTANNDIYGNTVYDNRKAGIIFQGSSLSNGCMNNIAENNIAVGTVSGQNFIATGGCENAGATGSGNVYTYNNFGAPSSNFITYGSDNLSTYAAFDAAFGTITHSVQSDPLFISTSTDDLALQASSPDIDAGANLGVTYEMALDPATTWPNGIVLDNQNSYGPGWEIGAYAYSQSPAAPAIALGGISPGATLSGTVSLTASSSAVAPASISSIQFYLDGSPLGSPVTSTSSPNTYSYSWNTMGANGSHALYALATDDYGNAASSSPITITVSNSAPPPGVVVEVGAGYASSAFVTSPASSTTGSQASSTGASSTSATTTASASASPSSLQTELDTLLAELQSLETQAGNVAPSSLSYIFTQNLSLWSTGSDVNELQTYLIQEDNGPAAGKLKQHGATDVFGFLTYDALVEFQKAVGIAPTGFFGPITRPYVNGHE